MTHPVATWPVLPDPETGGALLDRDGAQVVPGVDLELDDDGDLVVDSDAHFTPVDSVQAVAQGIRLRLQLFRGELFWNTDAGMPYLRRDDMAEGEAILGSKFDELKVRAAFRAEIVKAPGVGTLDELVVTFNRATRATLVRWHVTTTDGTPLDDELEI